MNIQNLLAIAAATFFALMSVNADEIKFVDGKNCVAWKAKKTLFLFKHVEPVGLNCDVDGFVVNQNGRQRLKLGIPIKKFDSGEPSRDKEVYKMLNGDRQPEIIFTSEPIDDTAIKAMVDAPKDILGLLNINGRAYPVHFNVTAKKIADNTEFTGELTTSFSNLDIPKIKVALGLVADVDDYLELHFHLLSSKIANYPKQL